MRRRWKSITALCMSAMIGCILPGSTMFAAEEDVEAVESVQETENSELSERDQQELESPERAEDEQQETESPEQAEGEQQVLKTSSASEAEERTEKAALVVAIWLQGTNRAQELRGKIEYETYVTNHDQQLSILGENATALYYYLDTAANTGDESKSEEQLADLWQKTERVNGQEIRLGQDGKYVLYVKAESADGQVIYARTDGIVIDATAPVIVGIDNGGTYPEGTSFRVTDDNLESVLINEQPAVPSADGTYRVAAAAYSSSCVIRAKDKAGNETVYSITVQEKKPGEDTTVILESGAYSLRKGTAYRLGSGTWTLEGDGTVYRGGSTFYVQVDGSYQFKRR